MSGESLIIYSFLCTLNIFCLLEVEIRKCLDVDVCSIRMSFFENALPFPSHEVCHFVLPLIRQDVSVCGCL